MAGDVPSQRQTKVDTAIAALGRGEPVCLHDFDDREGETDIVIPAGNITSEQVATLRNDAGGLICVAFRADVADAAELPYLADVIDHPTTEDGTLAYGDRSTFSLSVNHRDTYTGITDSDRALTIRKLGEFARQAVTGQAGVSEFTTEFRSPGHVHLLRATEGLLNERRGHTELGIALATAAGIPPAVVVCEMLDDESGGAMSVDQARGYATNHNIPFLEGTEVVETLDL